MTKIKRTYKCEGQVYVCAHDVNYRWWDIETRLTPEMREQLERDAEERAKECIIQGYEAGQLCSVLRTARKEEEVFGWWEIA